MDLFIEAANIYTEAGVIQNGVLHIRDGYIFDILDSSESIVKEELPEGVEWITTPCNIFPGLLELHIHGCNGYDVMDGSIESLDEISKYLAKYGVTGFLAATITDKLDKIKEVLAVVQKASEQGVSSATILGAYVEGPYISEKQKGAHLEQCIRNIDIDEIVELVEQNEIIRVMAIAPEKENALQAISYLCSKNIIPAVGHTAATYQEAIASFDSGAILAVHTFNCMSSLHHREPGALGAVLTDHRVYAEVIADLIHVHPAALKLLYQCKQKEKLCLVSDCMRAGGLGDGNYTLGQEQVYVQGGISRTKNGELAGSTLRLMDGVKNMHLLLGIDLLEAIHMASLIPARILGIEDQLGSIRPGKRADVILIDNDFNVIQTYIFGKRI